MAKEHHLTIQQYIVLVCFKLFIWTLTYVWVYASSEQNVN